MDQKDANSQEIDNFFFNLHLSIIKNYAHAYILIDNPKPIPEEKA